MSHEFGSIRISQQGKDQLIKLKRATGIKNWNTLCRWALCLSLVDDNRPLQVAATESNVEMSWKTFAGVDSAGLSALVVMRSASEDLPAHESLSRHIHRGLGILSGSIGRDGQIEDLLTVTRLTA